MLKKLSVALFCLAFTFLTACKDENSVTNLSKNEVYFFYQTTCPHCHTAAEYIKEHHPDLKVKSFDVKTPGNMKLFQQAVKDYGIHAAAGTPLIGMGNNYVMGWGDNEAKMFENYVKQYEE
jgi:glutaredoxin